MEEFMNETGGLRPMDDSRSFVPMVDVEETDDHFVMSFDMPGLKRENINIEVHGNQLVVSGERKQENERGEGRSRLIERRYGKFQRSVTIPEGINGEQVEAHYKDGVLTVAVPRAAQHKPHKVKIGDGKEGFFSKFLGQDSKRENNSKPMNVKSAAQSNEAAAS
jgi:HSP20 family protein